MKYLQLSQNKTATVCDCHYDLVKEYTWHYQPSRWGVDGYGQRSISYKDESGKKRCRTVKLHRFIMDAPRGVQVDHRDLNKLNNQCSNLRIGTLHNNLTNRPPMKGSQTGLKGVYISGKKYMAQIRVNHVLIYLGMFSDPNEAAKAYNVAATKHFGEWAGLNKCE